MFIFQKYLKKNKGKHPYLDKNIKLYESFIASNQSQTAPTRQEMMADPERCALH